MARNPPPPSLLFAFRGVRLLQALVAVAAGAVAIGALVLLRSALDEGGPWLLAPAAFLAILFFWLFGMALRLPTSFVAVSPERMRIRFGGFVDTIIETRDVAGARDLDWPWWKGLGVRTAFRGDAALLAAWGPAVEVTLRRPIRIWLIPRILPVRASRIVLGVKNPGKLTERFGPVKAPSSGARSPLRGGGARKSRW